MLIENCVTNTSNCNANGSIWCVVRIHILPYFFPIPFADDPCIWCWRKKLISLVAGYRCLFVINSKMLTLKPTTQWNIKNDEFVTENVKFSFSCCEGKFEQTRKENGRKKHLMRDDYDDRHWLMRFSSISYSATSYKIFFYCSTIFRSLQFAFFDFYFHSINRSGFFPFSGSFH